MSSQEEEDVPPREVCQKRIDGFVEVTHTDEALAQMMLQDHGWDLEKAIQAHFGGEPAAQASVPSATETAVSLFSWAFD